MHDGIRRSLIVFIVAALSLGVMFAWRGKDGGRLDLFSLFSGERAQQTKSEDIVLRDSPVLKLSEVQGLARLNQDFIKLTSRVSPAVVSISTGRQVNRPVLTRGVFGSRWRNESEWEPGLGSGVIVSEDGYIVTNYHVVDNVDKIEVTLAGDDEPLSVRLVDHNERLDIAILKINSDPKEPRKFAHLSLGDSDAVETGELVFAVGNPFGFKGTVTQGIISAKNRRMSDSSAELFQTNTIINPGNSGGPLVNIQGEVIGINTAIYSGSQQTGLWQGVGLAISSNDVKDVLEAVRQAGTPIRGYLGVSYQPSRSPRGSRNVVQIMGVEAGSPAERAGLKPGDIILEFGGSLVRGYDDFSNRVRRTHVGDKIKILVERGEEQVEVEAQIAELDEEKLIADRVRKAGNDALAVTRRMKSVGLEVSDRSGGGVVVEEVLPGSPWAAKVKKGDVIESLGLIQLPDSPPLRYAVRDARTLAYLMEQVEPDQWLRMGVLRVINGRVNRGTLQVQVPELG